MLKTADGITATVIVADLAVANAAQRVFTATEKADLQIDILINNAGFGGRQEIGKASACRFDGGDDPGPLQAMYYATKAFVTSFSQAIAEELSGTGVTSTALCPGAVDTGFVEAGELEGAALFQNPGASPESVAACGYKAMVRGDLVKVNEPSLSFALGWVIPFLPRRAVLKFSRKTMEKH